MVRGTRDALTHLLGRVGSRRLSKEGELRSVYDVMGLWWLMIVWTLRARWGNFGLKRIDVLCAGTLWTPSLIIIELMVRFRRRLFHSGSDYEELQGLLLPD